MRSAVVTALCLSACAASPVDPREAIVVQALVDADEVLLRTRPELMAGKYQRMSGTTFDFFRGSLAVAVADWEAGRTSRSGFGNALPVSGLGDPHPENFGLLLGRDGTFTFEPNDFDSASLVPYLFDVRRLLAGLAVATRSSSPASAPDVVARAAAESYVSSFLGLSDGTLTPSPITEAGDSRHLQDLFERGLRDLNARAELVDLTVIDESGQRHFLRGPPNPNEPTEVFQDVHPDLLASIPELLTRLPERGAMLDVVRQFGSGVASWPRLRFLVLLDGPT
ncbi:MAG: DUF2252 family protein, partial [Archangium sp.]